MAFFFFKIFNLYCYYFFKLFHPIQTASASVIIATFNVSMLLADYCAALANSDQVGGKLMLANEVKTKEIFLGKINSNNRSTSLKIIIAQPCPLI